MKLDSTIQQIEQELQANAMFKSLVLAYSEGSSINIEADGLYFLLYKNANGTFSSYLSEQSNGRENPSLDKIVTFTRNLETVASKLAVK